MGYLLILQIESIFYHVLTAIGVTVNFVVIVILKRGNCGLSKCITRYLMAMITADLLLVTIDVILNRINNIYFLIIFLFITPVCKLKIVLALAALHCSVWFTVAFSFDRFVASSCQKLKAKYCNKRTATVVIGTVSVVSCVRSIPWCFAFVPFITIDNMPWFCIETQEFYTSSFWIACEMIDSILIPLLPFTLMLVFNSMTIRNIIIVNRLRKGLRRQGRSDNESDPEMENRRKSIILLFALSANFILLWITSGAHSLNWQVVNYNFTNKYFRNPAYCFQQFGFMLRLLSSCTNTCIYALTLSKFREELKNGLKYPFILIAKLFERQYESESQQ
ncbi:probable G-protein coupled receptor 139 [Carcharodon carcharias]|uniref:probable G-protein coupled receptor 139 n=1 Tax=Carcharodon carcharias TaxID=13397 RepID=UPI001B7F48BE|nr:probable G-protein coupled receptor 139 [Carcharodon carcharias]